MKTRSSRSFRYLTALLTLLSLLTLAAPPPVSAQVMKTNDVPFPWTTLVAGSSSNVLTWGNSGGYAAGGSIKMQAPALGVTFTYSFSCPTVTLAVASCVIQGSTDNANWHNVPASSGGSGGAWTILVPASVASGNNTNVVYSTNFTQAQMGNYSWFRVASATNANAATISTPRLTAAWW